MTKFLDIDYKLTSSPWTSSLLVNRKFCAIYCSFKAVCTVQIVIIVELFCSPFPFTIRFWYAA